MEHQWRIEKRDVWAFPNFDSRIYGIRIENTGLGFVEDTPYSGCEPEEFRWADEVDPEQFNARTEAEWLALLGSWLADEESDAAFSVRVFVTNADFVNTDAIRTVRGDVALLGRCIRTCLRCNEEFMQAVEQQNETSRIGKHDHFGVHVRFDKAGVLDFSLWPKTKALDAAFPLVPQQIQALLNWVGPSRDEAKIQRYTALRRRIKDGSGQHHQINIKYRPRALTAHERTEKALELRDILFARFSPDEAQSLLEHILPSR